MHHCNLHVIAVIDTEGVEIDGVITQKVVKIR
jgi:hypothetical protein